MNCLIKSKKLDERVTFFSRILYFLDMDTPFDSDDDFDDVDDDSDDDDNDYDDVYDSDDDGFSDEYEELLGSDPQDPTDLPFYPPEINIDPYPKKRIIKTLPNVEEENPHPIRLVKGSPTRNRCLIVLLLFIIFFAITPFIVFMILS